ncbi:YdcF family protein [Hydrogenovibrio crunogenus]|uniref:YdcF family protein n=1 Tax=Hydrogenovibrio crunogenus TaxID=39765 RepID=A0A4P7NY20_9GAMM|nr:YdcF family protein [Hydrogenovibrio crunogenus]QBZ82395.1 YdcF family protein [Hydrogenovibrio crunogenus]
MDSLFFIVSKIAWAFLSPSNIILILLILGSIFLLFNRTETAKTLLLPASLAGFIVLAFPIGDLLIQPLEQRFKSPETLPKDIDGIIVLGGGEDLKRSLSWGRPELGIGGDRYIGAKELANHYPKAPVIFTGGSGSMQLQNTKGEGSLARQLLTTLGIANKRLIIESLSRNTYENFKYTKKLLPARQGTYMLVTSAFHMPRAVGIANKQAIHVIPYPVDYRGNSDKLRKIDFDFFDHLKSLEPAWKEWIGLTVYYWTGKTSDWLPETTLQTSQ